MVCARIGGGWVDSSIRVSTTRADAVRPYVNNIDQPNETVQVVGHNNDFVVV